MKSLTGSANQAAGGVFGSMGWSSQGMLSSLGMGSRRGGIFSKASFGNRSHARLGAVGTVGKDAAGRGGAGEGDASEQGLVAGLKPIRDRYLAGVLNRMNAPILQMFPEMEGYSGGLF